MHAGGQDLRAPGVSLGRPVAGRRDHVRHAAGQPPAGLLARVAGEPQEFQQARIAMNIIFLGFEFVTFFCCGFCRLTCGRYVHESLRSER